MPGLETGAVADPLPGVGVLPETLADPLLQDATDLAADLRVLAEEVEVAEAVAAEEGEPLAGEGLDLVLDVLLLAVVGLVVASHVQFVLVTCIYTGGKTVHY